MKLKGLWRHPDFMKLWAGQTISMFGAQVTTLALPLVAAITLEVSAFQMGLLTAIGYLPYILFSLFVGVWVDQFRRRPMMIITDLIRGLALLVLPIAAWQGFMTFELLCAVSFIVGTASVFFDIAYMSYLPGLVKTEELVEGNSKLEFSNSASQITGQTIGGGMIQLLTPPIALLLDGISFFVSAITLAVIRKKENKPENPEPKQDVVGNIKDGLAFVFKNPILARITISTGLFNLFGLTMESIYILHVTRDLDLSPLMLGLIFSMGGVGALLGAAIAQKVVKRIALGNTLFLMLTTAGLFYFLVLISDLLPYAAMVVVLMLVQFVDAATIVIYNINQRSLRAAITPDHMQGRMNASLRFIIFGSIPIGALLGGVIGSAFGTKITIAFGAAGMVIAGLLLLISPVAKLKEIPKQVEEASV
ncbi:MFS transporter [Paenibacillus sp. SC116]|uniref:MFS transporter n=1 Tax=Paenibacillus sp. SC116 TaxID=2968986 RepID=UPI00215A7E10|nr:MFS transporter [Paenibacillus sp. SC116]MCR8844950.1 MFS transporter [Paenibacillus sp. SC116]